MRLAIVSQEYPGVSDYSGGIGAQYRSLAPALAAQGIEVQVICAAPTEGPGPLELEGVRIHSLPLGLMWPWHPLLWARRVEEALRRTGPFDLVLGAEFRGELWSYAAHQRSGPAVTHLHTSSQQLLELRPGLTALERHGPRTRLYLGMERGQAERSVALVAPSRAVLDWARRAWPGVRGLPAEVLPNQVDLAQVRAQARGAAPPESFPRGRGPTVVLPARLEAHKGPQVLVDAARAVWGRHPDAQVVLIGRDRPYGKGMMGDHLRARAGDHGGRLHLLGDHPRAVVFATVAAADVVVVPSLWESFSLVALEAMALGRPVIGTSGNGMSEFLVDGENGLLTPPGDSAALAAAIDRLLSGAPLRHELGAAAARTADSFDATRVVLRYAEALERLAGRSSAARRGAARVAPMPAPAPAPARPGAVARAAAHMTRAGLLREPDFYRLRPGPGTVLDVGCGQKKWPGAVGIDISADTQADVVADLDELPWPLDDDAFDQILCQDVIEHVRRPLDFMAELHRVARPGARIHLRTPHYSSVLAYGDPTHEHYFSAMAIRTFEAPLFSHYMSAAFRVVELRLDFWDPLRWIGVAALANRFQSTYEMLFAFRFPAMNIRAELEVLK